MQMIKNPVLRNMVRKRPLRVPPEVPIGSVDPPHMETGTIGTWRLTLITDRKLTGKYLTLHLGGHRWVKLDMLCQTEDPSGEGYVSARAGHRALEPEPNPPPEKIHELMKARFRIPEGGIGTGEELEFVLGDTSGGSPGMEGTRFSVINAFFALETEPKPAEMPKNQFNWAGAFILHLLGGPCKNLRALAPSQVRSNSEFTLVIRPQDRWGNLSVESPRRLVLGLENREQEFDVLPEYFNPAGAISLPGLRLADEGVTRIQVEDPDTGTRTTSNPIIVDGSGQDLYWGLIHEHTEISDGSGSLDSCYQNMRYGSRLDFGAASDHDHRFETSDLMWEMTREAARRYYIPSEFTTLLGYEWAKWRRNGDGDRNVYYPHNDGILYRSETGEYDTPDKLFEALSREDALIIPHHTAYEGNFCDWSQHSPEKERLVEIYSVWGSSEMAAANGNPLPVRFGRDFNPVWVEVSGQKPKIAEEPVGFVQNALAKGWRTGFTGGGDMHKSHPGDDVTRGYPPYVYKPGLTGLWSVENTRTSIYRALKARSCYATTGARMILRMTLNGQPMGSELTLGGKEARHIWLEAHGTAGIEKIELVRNNGVIAVEDGKGKPDIEFEYSDDDEFGSVALPSTPWSKNPFIFYYLRVTQIDGEMGWTSPVWIEAGGEQD